MRRKEKEITDRSMIDAVIRQSLVCRLAMSDGDDPYVVPLCFGYADNALYFHSAGAGKKIDILKKNNRVCFEFDIDPMLVKKGQGGCDWGMKFQSVIGTGRAEFVEDEVSKRKALDIIMNQYDDGHFQYADDKVKRTVIIRVDIQEMTGKGSG
jgi:nitroimidazol reductase NimA-like FMN-containing flavoprotein (pyridoxamine 5'-phosphate oxidase superfamily)